MSEALPEVNRPTDPIEPRAPVPPPVQDTSPTIGEAYGEHSSPAHRLELPPALQVTPSRETAERIGAAVGGAQREIRRKLRLVKPTAKRAARQLESGVADARVKAAERADEWSERLQQLRDEAQAALERSVRRVRELADKYPLQTIAGVAAVACALGIAVRLGKGRSERG